MSVVNRIRIAAKLILYLFMLITAGCATLSDVDPLPQSILKRFAYITKWTTVTVFYDDSSLAGMAKILHMQNWRAEQTNGRVTLREMASSANGIYGKKGGRSLRLDQSFSAQAFLENRDVEAPGVERYRADRYRVRDLDGRGFEIRVNDGRGVIRFLPTPNDYSAQSSEQLRGFWRAPLGPKSEIFEFFIKRGPERHKQASHLWRFRGPFLHHDLKAQTKISVEVGGNFPTRFISPLQNAIKKWNQAVGTELMTLHKGRMVIDPITCLVQRKLCVRWQGPEAIPVFGLSAITEIAFDPMSGLILGGIINFESPKMGKKLAPMDQKLVSQAFGKTIDRKLLAKMILNRTDYRDLEHPFAREALEHYLLHEIGHFQGLAHNFAVPKRSSLDHPDFSVMAYLPFPVLHRATELGRADRLLISHLYRGTPLPDDGVPFCSTFEALIPRKTKLGYRRQEACDYYIAGNRADWYLNLANTGPQGVMTHYPDLRDLPPQSREQFLANVSDLGWPPWNLLTQFGFMLTEESSATAKDRKRLLTHLCQATAQRKQIAAQLKKYHGYQLSCATH